MLTITLALILLILSVFSLFVGVIDLDIASLHAGNAEQLNFFSHFPPTSVVGNPLYRCGNERGFIQRIQFKDVVMVPLVGIMFGNVIGGLTSYLAYKYEMTQALSSWLVGHFSLVLKGRYEIVGLTVPLVALAFVFANHFNIVGLGKDFSRNLGVPYNLVLFSGLTISAMITASIVVVVGSISYIGLIVPNVVAMYKGDRIRGTLADTALFGAIFVLVCDMIGRVVIFPYELPIELIVGILGSLIFIALLFCRLKYGRRAIRLGGTGTGCCSAMPGLKGGAEQ